MKILGIDTANQAMAVSFAEVIDKQISKKDIINLNTSKTHSISVLPSIKEILQRNNQQVKDLDLIAVAQGPGSFTGLRIGVTVAKVMAMEADLKLVGVSSLKVYAKEAQNLDQADYYIPMFDARNENVFAAVYQNKDGQLLDLLADQHIPVANLNNWIKENIDPNAKILFLTDSYKFQELIDQSLVDYHYDFGNYALSGEGILELAIKESPITNIDDFNPKYHRKTQAEMNWLNQNPNAKLDNLVDSYEAIE